MRLQRGGRGQGLGGGVESKPLRRDAEGQSKEQISFIYLVTELFKTKVSWILNNNVFMAKSFQHEPVKERDTIKRLQFLNICMTCM